MLRREHRREPASEREGARETREREKERKGRKKQDGGDAERAKSEETHRADRSHLKLLGCIAGRILISLPHAHHDR
eukprot:COSAG02_NODE_3624_length_6453_cov_7.466793_5_plen_76_part_00